MLYNIGYNMKLSCLGGILIILISYNNYGQTKNNWEIKSPMKINRAFHSMAVANGNIYVIGGSTGGANEFKDTPTVEMYDTQSEQWVFKILFVHLKVLKNFN